MRTPFKLAVLDWIFLFKLWFTFTLIWFTIMYEFGNRVVTPWYVEYIQVSSLFLDNYLRITLIHTHPQIAKLIEAGLCLSKLKDSKKIQIWEQNRNNNSDCSLYKSNIKKTKYLIYIMVKRNPAWRFQHYNLAVLNCWIKEILIFLWFFFLTSFSNLLEFSSTDGHRLGTNNFFVCLFVKTVCVSFLKLMI